MEKKRPKNALDMNSLVDLLSYARLGVEVPIFMASRNNRSIRAMIVTENMKIVYHENVDGHFLGDDSGYEFSLRDANIIPNKYNDWYTFDNLGDAMIYTHGDLYEKAVEISEKYESGA